MEKHSYTKTRPKNYSGYITLIVTNLKGLFFNNCFSLISKNHFKVFANININFLVTIINTNLV